jgi:hypothetical protein
LDASTCNACNSAGRKSKTVITKSKKVSKFMLKPKI